MKTTKINLDITCFRIKARSFPDGVLAAHQKLHGIFPYTTSRQYYGISRPVGQGQIEYWAAAEKLPGDVNKESLEEFMIPAGEYIYIDIENFRKDIPSIGKAFQQLLSDPRIDPNGFCLEWYPNMNDVRCMVRIIS